MNSCLCRPIYGNERKEQRHTAGGAGLADANACAHNVTGCFTTAEAFTYTVPKGERA